MTDIKKTPIPQRLKNVSSDHPYVAGAVDIVDDRLGVNQERVNETLQNGINALDSQNYYYAEATDQTSSVTDVLPPSGAADTLYRVASWDGEQYDATVYSEYAWDGTGYQILDVKEPGIDDEPTLGSNNLVKSDGIYNFKDVLVQLSKNNGIDLCLIDKNQNCLFYFKDGHIITKNFDSKDISTLKMEEDEFVDFAIKDSSGYIVAMCKDGDIITKNFNSKEAAISLSDSRIHDFSIQDEEGNTLLLIKEGNVITKDFDSRDISSKLIGEWKGKNICILGDSITYQGWYASALEKELDCHVYNRGWSGALVTPTVARGEDPDSQAFAFVHRFDTEYFPESISYMPNIGSTYHGMPPTENVDLMVIFGGTNDWGHGHEQSSTRTRISLGSITDAMSDTINDGTGGASFAAALKYTCYQAKLKYPNIPLALCTLLPSFGYNYSGTSQIASRNRSSEYVVNSDMSCVLQEKQFLDGNKTKEDINNIIRLVAKQFGAYLIDLDKMLGFPDFSEAMADLYYRIDGEHGDMTHPSQNLGAVVLGKFIAKQIKENIIYIEH